MIIQLFQPDFVYFVVRLTRLFLLRGYFPSVDCKNKVQHNIIQQPQTELKELDYGPTWLQDLKK